MTATIKHTDPALPEYRDIGRINDMDDPTGSLECLCPNSKGYFCPANKDGFIVWEGVPADSLIRPCPTKEEMHALCPECGNLFSDEQLRKATKPLIIPVKVIGLNDPAHVANRIAYENK
jgi:hypothetical protein